MRIFITVGNAFNPFDRVLAWADEAIASLDVPVEGICQYGHSTIRPRKLNCQQSLSRTEFDSEIARADVVICHAGVGTLWSALREGHRPLVVPRLGSLGEHVNDHQLEIVDALRKEERIEVIRDASHMASELQRYARQQVRRGNPHTDDPLRFTKVAAAIGQGSIRETTSRASKLALRLLARFGPSLEKMRQR